MQRVKWVIFDLGGIVISESKEYIDKSIAEYLDISIKQYHKLTEKYQHRLTTGDITLLQVYTHIIRQLKISIKPQSVLDKHLSIFREVSTQKDSEILQMIVQLTKICSVGCLTNTEIEIAELNKKTGLFDCFEKVYLSTEIGLRKPISSIYKYLLDDLGCSPKEVIFIDDKYENVESAQRIGINSIQFISVIQLRKYLSDICKLTNLNFTQK